MQPIHNARGRRPSPRIVCLLLAAGFLWGGLLPAGGLAADRHLSYDRLPVPAVKPLSGDGLPGGPAASERQLHRQGELQRRWRIVHETVGEQHVSKRSQTLLSQRGLGPALLGAADQAAAKALTGTDTLKVLIVRVSFAENRDPDLTTIPADGDFDLGAITDPDSLVIDPPPHDRAYFEAHLLGLNEYYRCQSGGRLFIQGKVLPEGDDDSYQLSDIADYGPGREGFWSIDSLETLVRDMIDAADEGIQADGGFPVLGESGSRTLADFDDDDPFTYVIFVHSGSDWQSDINGDSPNDIPTFFVSLGEAQPLTSNDVESGLPGGLTECSVIPETSTQDGYDGGIAAAFYHEFGHALGLPDVYSTSTGLTSVGIWDLMDSGTNLYVPVSLLTSTGDIITVVASGVLPPSLSAWDKWFLGWVTTGRLDGRELDYRLPAIQVPREDYSFFRAGYGDFNPAYPQVLQAGLSNREFFLLENRWVPDSVTETPFLGIAYERDEATGVILYLAGLRNDTWVNSGLYDYFMPPGGVLVWHVNTDRIEAGLADNAINAHGDGLRLVEADGIQDVGSTEAYYLGWIGSADDPFGTNSGYQDLYVQGAPSSRAYDRSWTGVWLESVRPDNPALGGSVMRFGAGIETVLPGFPWEAAPVDTVFAAAAGGRTGARGLDPGSLTPLVIGGEPVLVAADAAPAGWGETDFPAALYGLRADGGARWNPVAGRPAGAFAALDAELAGPPLLVAGPGGVTALVWGTRAGTLGLTVLPDSDNAVTLWTRRLGARLAAGPVVLPLPTGGDLRLCAVAPDTLLAVDADGLPLGPAVALRQLDPVPGDFDILAVRRLPYPAAGLEDPLLHGAAAVLGEAGWLLVRSAVAGLDSEPIYVAYAGRTAAGALQSAAVPDAAGGVALHVFDDLGALGSWRITPQDLVAADVLIDPRVPLAGEPAVADLNADGRQDLILATGRRLLAVDARGLAVTGFPVELVDLFPLADTTRVQGPLIVADADGDGLNEVFFFTNGGHLLGLGQGGRLLDQLPLRWGDRHPAGAAVGAGPAGSGTRLLWLAASGGRSGPPLDRQLFNGRLSALQWPGDAGAALRTSEWLGAAGGSLREGPEGTVRALELDPVLARDAAAVTVYPNPVRGRQFTVRFTAEAAGSGRLTLYNLEGEEVRHVDFAVAADAVNEVPLEVPELASGLYLGRLVVPAASGRRISTLTIAIER